MAGKTRQRRSQELRTPAATQEWIDVSVPIYGGMVHWPDNPSVELNAIMHVERGDICTVSALDMGTHTGTHIDGPIHFIPGGEGVATSLRSRKTPRRIWRSSTPSRLESTISRWAALKCTAPCSELAW